MPAQLAYERYHGAPIESISLFVPPNGYGDQNHGCFFTLAGFRCGRELPLDGMKKQIAQIEGSYTRKEEQ